MRFAQVETIHLHVNFLACQFLPILMMLFSMSSLGQSLGVPVHVFGTETHMTAIVGMALGTSPIPEKQPTDPGHTANFLLGASSQYSVKSLIPVHNTGMV